MIDEESLLEVVEKYANEVKHYTDKPLVFVDENFDASNFLSLLNLFFVREESFESTLFTLLLMNGITVKQEYKDEFVRKTISIIKHIKKNFQ